MSGILNTENGIKTVRQDAGNALTKLFLAVFLCAFAVIWVRVAGSSQSKLLVPIAALGAGQLCVVYSILGNRERTHEKHFCKIAAVCALLIFALNVVNGYALRFTPVFDLGAIYSGASGWASSGSFVGMLDCTCDPDYFYYFPNNIGGMAFLYLPFKLAALLGIHDTFAVAMIFNALLIAATVFVTAITCRRILGAKAGIVALACLMLTPPLYFMAPAFYTDSLSMLFPVLTLYAYLRMRAAAGTKGRLAFAMLMGLSAGIGMLVKFTVVIVLIAIAIGALLQRETRKLLPHILAAAVVAAWLSLMLNGYIYANHLDKNKADELNTPYLHWVMMSLEEEGGYNPKDYEFTRSFSEPDERNAAIRAQIISRVREKGTLGLLSHMGKKGAIDFGDGTFALSDFLDDGPVNETELHSVLLYAGEKYPEYRLICTGWFLSLQLLMILAAAMGLIKGMKCDAVIPLISMFGLLLFLVCWEVSARYVTNYLPMIAICAATGLNSLFTALQSKKTAPLNLRGAASRKQTKAKANA